MSATNKFARGTFSWRFTCKIFSVYCRWNSNGAQRKMGQGGYVPNWRWRCTRSTCCWQKRQRPI